MIDDKVGQTEQVRGSKNDGNDWAQCPKGALTGYSHRLHRRRFLMLTAKTVGGVGCMAAVSAGFWLQYLRRLENDYQNSGLTCADINELFPAYQAGKLDVTRTNLLEEHVRRCSRCSPLRVKLRPPTV